MQATERMRMPEDPIVGARQGGEAKESTWHPVPRKYLELIQDGIVFCLSRNPALNHGN